ncbi:hypothetical protein ACF1DV_37560 [Streptomyces achromogenes]
MTGHLLLGSLALFALHGWRAPEGDMRFLARLSLLMAVLIALDLWWVL